MSKLTYFKIKKAFYQIASFFIKCDLEEIDYEEIRENIINRKKSLVRWGDGEAVICMGSGIKYQKFSENLAIDLKNAITKNDENIIICAPNQFLLKSNLELIKSNKWRAWLHTKTFYALNFEKCKFGDAFGFRPESKFKYKTILTELINRYNKIISISSEDEKDIKTIKSLLMKSNHEVKIGKIKIKPKNTYDDIEKIIKIVEKNKNALYLVSAGPAGKIIIKYISSYTQAIDVGHLYTMDYLS